MITTFEGKKVLVELKFVWKQAVLEVAPTIHLFGCDHMGLSCKALFGLGNNTL